jgi:hypothetical protein
MSSLPRVSMLCALAVAFAASVYAQPPGQAKKAPNQTVQTGHNEPTDPQTGRPREATPEETAALEAALQSFGKRAEGATFTVYDNGMVRAELDDTFMEAMTVTVMPDGSLKYGHTSVATQKAVKKTAKTAKKTAKSVDKTAKKIEKVSAKKQAAPGKAKVKPPVAKVKPPVFEEKE